MTLLLICIRHSNVLTLVESRMFHLILLVRGLIAQITCFVYFVNNVHNPFGLAMVAFVVAVAQMLKSGPLEQLWGGFGGTCNRTFTVNQ